MSAISPTTIKLIAGLGNPGRAYAHTYHNAGFQFLEAYRKHVRSSGNWKKERLFQYARTNGIVLVEPLVFMNESGPAIRAAAKFFDVKPAELLIAHDESDLPLGEFRFSFGRGGAGHRGVASAIATLRTKNFWRLRIGVRTRPGRAGDFVLRKISQSAAHLLHRAFGSSIAIMTENATP